MQIDGPLLFRNRVINPSARIKQAGLASTASGSYDFDQWIVLTQSSSVSPSQAGSVENGTPYMMRLTQANASAQRMGRIQWMETDNVIDLRGKTVVLSARVQLSTSANIRMAIVEWTGSADAPTVNPVNDWTSGTYTTGNFFKSTTTTIAAVSGSLALTASTPTTVSLSGTVSGSMANLAVFFWTEGTAAQNVTFDVGRVQLETGSVATDFSYRSLQEEMALCQRYYITSYDHGTTPGTATNASARIYRAVTTGTDQVAVQLPVPMLKAPTVTFYSPNSGTSGKWYDASASADLTTTIIPGAGTKGFSASVASSTYTNTVQGHWVAVARF